MGEVRIRVKVTNAADLAMVKRNLLPRDQVRSYEAEALVDTVAVSLILPSFLVERLGLARPFKQVAEYADGRHDEVDVTEPVLVESAKHILATGRQTRARTRTCASIACALSWGQ